MKFKAGNAIIFIIGAAVGAAVSGIYFKKRYEKIARLDNEMRRKRERDKSKMPKTDTTAEIKTYSDAINTCGYKAEEKTAVCEPVVISPEEFGENDEYDTCSFTYYANDILTDECDEPIGSDEIQNLIGAKALKSFGKYEDDSVFVCNDEKKCYYEILKDFRKYGG